MEHTKTSGSTINQSRVNCRADAKKKKNSCPKKRDLVKNVDERTKDEERRPVNISTRETRLGASSGEIYLVAAKV